MTRSVEELARAHGRIVRDQLGHLYSLHPSLELLHQQPREVAQAFVDYTSLFPRFFSLSPQERQVVDEVAAKMGDNHHQSASAFREAVSGHEQLLCAAVRRVVDPGSTFYRAGMATLASMMTAAWDMQVDGRKPRDGDPRSDRVIWGYVLGASHP